MNIAKDHLSKDKETECCINAQSLEILGLSSHKVTPKHIKEWLTSLPEDSPVNLSAPPVYVKLKTMQEICGLQRMKPFASFSRDFSSLRTYRTYSLFPTSTEYLENCPESGIVLNGVCYQAKMWEHSIKGIDFGFLERKTLLPTISRVSGFRLGSKVKKYKQQLTKIFGAVAAREFISNPLSANPALFEFLMGWPIGWTSLRPLKKVILPRWTLDNLKKPAPIKKVNYQQERINALGNGQVPLCVYALLKLWLFKE